MVQLQAGIVEVEAVDHATIGGIQAGRQVTCGQVLEDGMLDLWV